MKVWFLGNFSCSGFFLNLLGVGGENVGSDYKFRSLGDMDFLFETKE